MFLNTVIQPPRRCTRCRSIDRSRYYGVDATTTLCRRCACLAVFNKVSPDNLAAIDAFDPARDYESLLAQAVRILDQDSPPMHLETRLRAAKRAVSPHIRLRRQTDNHIEATSPVFRRTLGPYESQAHGPRPMVPNPSPLPLDHPSPFQAIVSATRTAIAAGMSATASRVYVYHLRGEHPVICTIAGPNRVRITSTNNRIAFLETQS